MCESAQRGGSPPELRLGCTGAVLRDRLQEHYYIEANKRIAEWKVFRFGERVWRDRPSPSCRIAFRTRTRTRTQEQLRREC